MACSEHSDTVGAYLHCDCGDGSEGRWSDILKLQYLAGAQRVSWNERWRGAPCPRRRKSRGGVDMLDWPARRGYPESRDRDGRGQRLGESRAADESSATRDFDASVEERKGIRYGALKTSGGLGRGNDVWFIAGGVGVALRSECA